MLLPLAMLSDWHVIVLLSIVVLLFGGKKLPEVARGLGEAMREFKKASRDFQAESQSTANGQRHLPRNRQRLLLRNPPSQNAPRAFPGALVVFEEESVKRGSVDERRHLQRWGL